MHRNSTPHRAVQAADRHRALDELDRALAEAEQLTATLSPEPGEQAELAALRARILLVRAALDAMRAEAPRAIGPDWSDLLPWMTLFDGGNQTPAGKSPPPPNSRK
jgi:hypothetical protein